MDVNATIGQYKKSQGEVVVEDETASDGGDPLVNDDDEEEVKGKKEGEGQDVKTGKAINTAGTQRYYYLFTFLPSFLSISISFHYNPFPFPRNPLSSGKQPHSNRQVSNPIKVNKTASQYKNQAQAEADSETELSGQDGSETPENEEEEQGGKGQGKGARERGKGKGERKGQVGNP